LAHVRVIAPLLKGEVKRSLVEGDIDPDAEGAGEGLVELALGDVQPDTKTVITSRVVKIPIISFVFIGITLDEAYSL